MWHTADYDRLMSSAIFRRRLDEYVDYFVKEHLDIRRRPDCPQTADYVEEIKKELARENGESIVKTVSLAYFNRICAQEEATYFYACKLFPLTGNEPTAFERRPECQEFIIRKDKLGFYEFLLGQLSQRDRNYLSFIEEEYGMKLRKWEKETPRCFLDFFGNAYLGLLCQVLDHHNTFITEEAFREEGLSAFISEMTFQCGLTRGVADIFKGVKSDEKFGSNLLIEKTKLDIEEYSKLYFDFLKRVIVKISQ